jgi:hypothetical protein
MKWYHWLLFPVVMAILVAVTLLTRSDPRTF